MSETSTQAQILPLRERWRKNENAIAVRPLDSIPTISVMAPTGSLPSSSASTSRITRGVNQSLERR